MNDYKIVEWTFKNDSFSRTLWKKNKKNDSAFTEQTIFLKKLSLFTERRIFLKELFFCTNNFTQLSFTEKTNEKDENEWYFYARKK